MVVNTERGLEDDDMRYSTRLSDAVHVLAFVALTCDPGLTSERIAESIRTNPAHVRKLMSDLKRAGIIVNTPGHPRPALTRDTTGISILDVYRAVEGDKPLLHLDTHTNPECGAGVMIQASLKDFYDEIQAEAEAKMAAITLEDVIRNFRDHCDAAGIDAGSLRIQPKEKVGTRLADGPRL